MRAAPVPLEGQAHAQLNFARRKGRGECKGLVRVKIRAAVDRKGRCESRANHVIYTGIVRVISEVKILGSKVQRSLLAEFKRAAQTHVEVCVAWTLSRVSSGSGRPVVGEVTVTIDVRSCQKIERVAAVVAEDRSKLEAAKDLRIVKWT